MKSKLLAIFLITSLSLWSQCVSGNCKNGYGIYKYKNGDFYKGNWINGKWDGKGTHFKKNAGNYYVKVKKKYKSFPLTITYTGEFKEGKRHGKGKMNRNDSTSYNGAWKNNLKHGYGVQISRSEKYIGNWANGKKNGFGEEWLLKNTYYKGNWVDGYHIGKGMRTLGEDTVWGIFDKHSCTNHDSIHYLNGDKFVGNCHPYEKNCFGTMRYNNGDIYKGKWDLEQKIGKGKMTYANGDVYEGDWYYNHKHGKGTYTYKNGDVYKGSFNSSKKQGKGILVYANGDIYDGEWEEDYKHGKGTLTYANRDIFTGTWKHDTIYGHGTKYMPRKNFLWIKKEKKGNWYANEFYKNKPLPPMLVFFHKQDTITTVANHILLDGSIPKPNKETELFVNGERCHINSGQKFHFYARPLKVGINEFVFVAITGDGQKKTVKKVVLKSKN